MKALKMEKDCVRMVCRKPGEEKCGGKRDGQGEAKLYTEQGIILAAV